MPINDEGVEVNEDGTPITKEQMETSNWTQVIELHDKTKLKPYSMEEMATTTVPHNIPYLELYRTDELYYEEYKSQFLSDSGNTTLDSYTTSSDSDSSDDSSSDSSTGTSSPTNPTHSSKNKNPQLTNELKNIVKNHFKKEANYNTLVRRYRECKTNEKIIALVTYRSKKWLKDGTNTASLVSAILRTKRNYT